MRIRWGRGFFRLWVVGSLAWAAFVGVLARPDAAFLESARPADPAGYAKPQTDGARREHVRLLVVNNEAFAAAVQQADRSAAIKTLAWFAWVVGIPSALALIAGLAAAWVVRGFVRS